MSRPNSIHDQALWQMIREHAKFKPSIVYGREFTIHEAPQSHIDLIKGFESKSRAREVCDPVYKAVRERIESKYDPNELYTFIISLLMSLDLLRKKGAFTGKEAEFVTAWAATNTETRGIIMKDIQKDVFGLSPTDFIQKVNNVVQLSVIQDDDVILIESDHEDADPDNMVQPHQRRDASSLPVSDLEAKGGAGSNDMEEAGNDDMEEAGSVDIQAEAYRAQFRDKASLLFESGYTVMQVLEAKVCKEMAEEFGIQKEKIQDFEYMKKRQDTGSFSFYSLARQKTETNVSEIVDEFANIIGEQWGFDGQTHQVTWEDKYLIAYNTHPNDENPHQHIETTISNGCRVSFWINLSAPYKVTLHPKKFQRPDKYPQGITKPGVYALKEESDEYRMYTAQKINIEVPTGHVILLDPRIEHDINQINDKSCFDHIRVCYSANIVYS